MTKDKCTESTLLDTTLFLKKIYSDDIVLGGVNPRYVFTTCCKNIVSLQNCCTESKLALKILKCISLVDTGKDICHTRPDYEDHEDNEDNEYKKSVVFEVDQICVRGINLKTGKPINIELDGPGADKCFLIPLDTHDHEKHNSYCIDQIVVRVTPSCLCKSDFGMSVSLGDFADVVCYDEDLEDCANTDEPRI